MISNLKEYSTYLVSDVYLLVGCVGGVGEVVVCDEYDGAGRQVQPGVGHQIEAERHRMDVQQVRLSHVLAV